MKSEFDIKVTVLSMYRFLMNHTYRGLSGAVSLVGGIGLIVLYFAMRNGGTGNTWLYLFFGGLFLVYLPWTLYSRALKQVKLNPVFKHPLHYVLTEETLEVQQGEASNQIKWENVWMVRETGQSILVYTSQKNAFIWIKDQLGNQEQTVRALLEKVIDPKRLKLKRG